MRQMDRKRALSPEFSLFIGPYFVSSQQGRLTIGTPSRVGEPKGSEVIPPLVSRERQSQISSRLHRALNPAEFALLDTRGGSRAILM
jgi:hypothetical protein